MAELVEESFREDNWDFTLDDIPDITLDLDIFSEPLVYHPSTPETLTKNASSFYSPSETLEYFDSLHSHSKTLTENEETTINGMEQIMTVEETVEPNITIMEENLDLKIREMEKALLVEDEQLQDDEGFSEIFFSDIFPENSEKSSESSPVSGVSSQSVDIFAGEADKQVEPSPESGGLVESPVIVEDESNVAEEKEEEKEGDEDHLSKKRKRQIRNRDSALRSRERRKEFVKDLEIKSKYLEAECRRLQNLLGFCYAENNALRLHIQKRNNEVAAGLVRAKQESAVLPLESLLLGSLFWLLIMVSAFLSIGPFSVSHPELVLRLDRSLGQELTSLKRLWVRPETLESKPRSPVALLLRRWRFSRTKMKMRAISCSMDLNFRERVSWPLFKDGDLSIS
ncbi:hypothetical protein AMTRI_Chr03g43910 [Amborella trichopoda]|uniref:BZIP domain-containing protein n=1 Tax=Amborella trichopoda TaxID=13333 RepID=W1PTX6_AMBTC|nr:bZIP transcription factor 60 [Amborella trichopoda]ERN11513.1 hypothetical protein AMTR_s00022p00120000 [Amborella trichopoda]|eukprot:XP_006849932.1 bZIP transcription factor 60 [Amborella trichopoda]